MPRYDTILIDAHSLSLGLQERTVGAAIVKFHRVLGSIASRYLDTERSLPVCGVAEKFRAPGSEVVVFGEFVDLEGDIIQTAKNLGLTTATGNTPIQLLARCMRSVRGNSCLIVSDDSSARAYLTDVPDPVHLLLGAADIESRLTLTTLIRNGEQRPHEVVRDVGPLISIDRNESDLKRHRWWLVEIGAEEALTPDGWQLVKRLIR